MKELLISSTVYECIVLDNGNSKLISAHDNLIVADTELCLADEYSNLSLPAWNDRDINGRLIRHAISSCVYMCVDNATTYYNDAHMPVMINALQIAAAATLHTELIAAHSSVVNAEIQSLTCGYICDIIDNLSDSCKVIVSIAMDALNKSLYNHTVKSNYEHIAAAYKAVKAYINEHNKMIAYQHELTETIELYEQQI